MAQVYQYKRLDSMVIAGYPWITDTLVSQPDLLHYFGENHILKDFLVSFRQFEIQDLSRQDILGFDLRKLLRVEDSSNGTTSTAHGYKPLATTLAGPFFSYICANRLVDITSWLDGRPPMMSVPRHKQQTNVGKVSFQKWNTLNNWPDIFLRCHSLFKENQPNTLADVQSSINLENRCFSLLSSIAQRCESSKEMTISLNVEIAAMHLSIMWKGQLDFPHKIDWFRSESNSKYIDSKSMKFLEDLYSNSSSVHRFKMPLHLSLIISPLILLIPNKLHTKDWDQKALLLMGKKLGNQRPDSLLNAEKHMWKIIFCTGRGERTARDGIRDVLAHLPPDLLNEISSADCQWFPKVQVDNSGASAKQRWDPLLELHKADVEGPVPSGWPPLKLLNTTCQYRTTNEITIGVDVSSSHLPVDVESAIDNLGTDNINVPPDSLRSQPYDENLLTAGGPSKANHQQHEKYTAQSRSASSSGDLLIDPCTLPDLTSNIRLASAPRRPATASSEELVDPTQHKISELSPRRSSRTKSTPAVDYSNNSIPQPRRYRKPLPPSPLKFDRQSSDCQSVFPPGAGSSENLPPSPLKFDRQSSDCQSVFPPGAGSSENPIDVDTIFLYLQGRSPATVTLDAHQMPNQMFSCSSQILYDPYCKEVPTVMEFHSQVRVDQYEKLIQSIENCFVDGMPLHSSNTKSMFYVISEGQLAAHKLQEIHQIHGKQHILITEMATSHLTFDEYGLETLKSVEAVIDIYDFSHNSGVELQNDEQYRRKGSLSQMLKCAGRQRSKILSTAEIPLGLSGIPSLFFSTDLYAWRKTEGDPFCDSATSYPVDCMRWGLAATRGALRSWQLAPNGFGHYIDVQVGLVLAIIARPKVTTNVRDPFSNINLYGPKFNPQEDNAELWDLEAVVLSPGTRLILKPNTPYRFLFLENSICYGGRFYSTHTLQDTFIAIIHGFISNSITSNAPYSSVFRQLLQRILYLYYHSFVIGSSKSAVLASHLPDLSQTKSVIGFLTLYVIMTLINVLDPETYVHQNSSLTQYDQNTLSPKERLACMFA